MLALDVEADDLVVTRSRLETSLARVERAFGGWQKGAEHVDKHQKKTLLNRVIEAEKEAAANVILRREETAAAAMGGTPEE